VTGGRLKIAVIAGEESGDILGADFIAAMQLYHELDVIGVGGAHMSSHGLKSLFDPSQIALMGVASIITKIPRLIALIQRTSDFIIKQNPDCLIIIDSPEFCQRVARKVRRADPSIPIVNYICPSVWAWRPGRAKAMKTYIDHVLTILPFEPQVLQNLGGPPATYVGHRAAFEPAFIQASLHQEQLETGRKAGGEKKLLLLPGSRRSEVRRTMDHMGDTVRILQNRGHALRLWLPTVPHLEDDVRRLCQKWIIQPEITTNPLRKVEMFSNADAALAASGTVTLELALCRVPTVSIYDFDPLARLWVRQLFKSWTASLPNLIADEPVVFEYYNEQIRPGMLARQIERLMLPGSTRDAQLIGFSKVRANMRTQTPPGEKAAQAVMQIINFPKIAEIKSRDLIL
jgi:lipid-A-disaccharide synthase